jgi:hypothetical protein
MDSLPFDTAGGILDRRDSPSFTNNKNNERNRIVPAFLIDFYYCFIEIIWQEKKNNE